jgi:hypothetical protein
MYPQEKVSNDETLLYTGYFPEKLQLKLDSLEPIPLVNPVLVVVDPVNPVLVQHATRVYLLLCCCCCSCCCGDISQSANASPAVA